MGEIILTIWFFCPLITPVIASLAREDDSEIGGCAVIFIWFIVGLILGPIALIAVIILYIKKGNGNKQNIRLTKCPACYNKVSRNADSCPDCGEPL